MLTQAIVGSLQAEGWILRGIRENLGVTAVAGA